MNRLLYAIALFLALSVASAHAKQHWHMDFQAKTDNSVRPDGTSPHWENPSPSSRNKDLFNDLDVGRNPTDMTSWTAGARTWAPTALDDDEPVTTPPIPLPFWVRDYEGRTPESAGIRNPFQPPPGFRSAGDHDPWWNSRKPDEDEMVVVVVPRRVAVAILAQFREAAFIPPGQAHMTGFSSSPRPPYQSLPRTRSGVWWGEGQSFVEGDRGDRPRPLPNLITRRSSADMMPTDPTR